jgi:hypothetical protein
MEGYDTHYLQRLMAQTRDKKLADARLWHLLLHYKPRWLGGFKSEADGEGFFFHPDGKVDPQGELEATLRAFFSTEQADKQEENWQHPQCRFPARYHWLKAQLGFDAQKLPEQLCPRFDAWRTALDPGSVSLIFAAHYMSNPASMFGHTLLRLNHKKRPGSQNLLDYGINYAAITTTTNGFLYALFGVTGGFEGRFASFPYYLKVQEYSNLESRDLWEYDLNLHQEQIDRMLQHLWELGNTYFRYYFFQENCSYHILSLLEVANPALHLTDQFFFAVIPTDTVRLITQQEGLVTNVVYRPSIVSQFTQKRQGMDTTELQLLRRTLKTKSLQAIEDSSLDLQRKALVLDAALDMVQYRKLQTVDDLSPVDTEFRRKLLVYRSQLGVTSSDVPQDPVSSRPELGHGTARLRLAFGFATEQREFFELSYPAFHDLLDPEEGFPPYSQIQLLTPTVRYYPALRRFTLERFDAIRITSLSPVDSFFKKPSWRVDVGYQTLRDVECGLCHWWKAEVGTGVAIPLDQSASHLAYAFFNLETGLSEAFDPDFRLSPGGMVGVVFQPLSVWTLDIGASLYYPVLGGDKLYYRNYLHQHVAFTRNLGVRFELNQFKTTIEGLAALHIYF